MRSNPNMEFRSSKLNDFFTYTGLCAVYKGSKIKRQRMEKGKRKLSDRESERERDR